MIEAGRLGHWASRALERAAKVLVQGEQPAQAFKQPQPLLAKRPHAPRPRCLHVAELAECRSAALDLLIDLVFCFDPVVPGETED
jgi:hypothetical protein